MVVSYYDDGRAAVYVGHVLDVLAGLEAGSVQTGATSPPYWGLRAYGTEPQVWGGDPMCSHSLEETAPGKVLTDGTGTASAKQVSNAGSQYGNGRMIVGNNSAVRGPAGMGLFHGGLKAAADGNQHVVATGAICTRCGAWRGELGSEPTPQMYVDHIVEVFRAVRRVLHDSGTIWVNLGDSYSGSGKGPTGHNGIGDQGQRQGFVDQRTDVPGLGPKQLMMMPARVALALQADGWVLRQQIIWAKPNPMPESVTDRCTTAHEYLFLLAKNPTYYFDNDAIREPHAAPERQGQRNSGWDFGDYNAGNSEHVLAYNPAGRNRRSVWTIPTEAYPAAHFATFPRKLVEPCILAGTSARGQCPACGAPWTRTTERAYAATPKACKGPTRNGKLATEVEQQDRGVNWARDGHVKGLVRADTTTGWEQSCPCPHQEPIAQTVLDPFAGSGTTLAVARWHQRRAVGIELNPEYARLIEQRLAQGVLL